MPDRIAIGLPPEERTVVAEELLAGFPPSLAVDPAELVRIAAVAASVLVVIDDDPTGSQSVADVPVLTSWEEEDFGWAFAQARPLIFVLTNSRSVAADEAAMRNEAAVANATKAAQTTGHRLTFLSRSDSVLRGHYPQETDAIERALVSTGAPALDGVILVPAFPSAGRITVGGVHYLREGETLVPAAQTQFARDASFAYAHSDLREYVAEKTAGRVPAADVTVIDLASIRTSAEAIADLVEPAVNGAVLVADCVTDDDLRALCVGLALAESRGKVFLYRTGPAFVGARVGQVQPEPLDVADVLADADSRERGGLIVVGSHVDLTNRQLDALRTARPDILEIEVDVERLGLASSSGEATAEYLDSIVHEITEALRVNDVMIRTSRVLRTGTSAEESLRIARAVSAGVSAIVHAVASEVRPRYVIAKGGITSNDTASDGLDIRRGTIRGPLLRGLVSLWQAAEGLARGIPYVVFPGNVGDDHALVTVVGKLSDHSPPKHQS
jgi:uncharacterized protein YgbK (DUF1537 family)